MGQNIVRSILLVLGGAVGGAILTLAAVALLSSDAHRSDLLEGPVAIIPAESAKRGYLGITFSNEPSRSLYVADVSTAVPTELPHVAVGDLVTSLNARPVKAFAEVQSLFAGSKPGDTVELDIVRDEQPINLKVRLLSVADMYATRTRSGGPAAP